MGRENLFHKAPARPGMIPAQVVAINVDGLDKVVPLHVAFNFMYNRLKDQTADVQKLAEDLKKQFESIAINTEGFIRYLGDLPSIEYLPAEPKKGDSYRVLHSFSLEDKNYSSGTIVFYTGTDWGIFGGAEEGGELDESIQQEIIEQLTPELKKIAEEAINEKLNWFTP